MTAERINRVVELVNDFCEYLTSLFQAIQSVQTKGKSKQNIYRKKNTAPMVSRGPERNLVPMCSAGPRTSTSGSETNESSLLDTQNEISSIKTYDILEYNPKVPSPRAAFWNRKKKDSSNSDSSSDLTGSTDESIKESEVQPQIVEPKVKKVEKKLKAKEMNEAISDDNFVVGSGSL